MKRKRSKLSKAALQRRRHQRNQSQAPLRKRSTLPKGHVYCPFCFRSHLAPIFKEDEGIYIQEETCEEMRKALKVVFARRLADVLVKLL